MRRISVRRRLSLVISMLERMIVSVISMLETSKFGSSLAYAQIFLLEINDIFMIYMRINFMYTYIYIHIHV